MNSLAEKIYKGRLLLGAKIWPRLLPRKTRLVRANLRLTENCQARCVTCDYWKKRWEDGISTDTAVGIIDRLAEMGVPHINFSGGEPLLREDMFEILRRAESERFRIISVVSNGLLLKKLHRQINDSPITRVTISIDALGERNDTIRGVKGYFDKTLEGAQMLSGKEIRLCATLTGPGADDLEGLMDICRRNGWRFLFNLLDNRSWNFQNADMASVWPGPREVEKIIGTLKERAGRPPYELDYMRDYYLRGGPADGPDEPPCVRGFKIIYIHSNGDVSSGCLGLPPIGNVFEADIAEIVEADSYRERRLQMLKRECPGCTCGVEVNLRVENYLGWLANGANSSLKG